MLIGLTGKAGSGKDQSYEFVKDWAEAQGLPVRREAFADRLKLSAARIFHPSITLADAVAWCNELKQEPGLAGVAVVDNTERPQHFVTGREYLQRYGTEAHRDVFHEDFWIHAVTDTYRHGDEILVVTDVRFPNEAAAIRELGGYIWQILRPGNVSVASAHPTEQPLPRHLIDHTIANDYDLAHLRGLVEMHLHRIINPTDICN